jgi:hypothetical protein
VFGEGLLRLAYLAALQVPDLERDPFERAADDRQTGQNRGVPVARDDLGRYRLRCQAERGQCLLLDRRVDMGERPHRT